MYNLLTKGSGLGVRVGGGENIYLERGGWRSRVKGGGGEGGCRSQNDSVKTHK